jgi:hypothetical protein
MFIALHYKTTIAGRGILPDVTPTSTLKIKQRNNPELNSDIGVYKPT